MFALVVGVGFTSDNAIDVLTNSAGTFDRLWRDLREAQHCITVQMYYAGPGEVADMAIDILASKARDGIDVYYLYDAFGTRDLPRQCFEALSAAGAHTAEYRPVRWYTLLDNAAHRLHVRGVVIAGRVAYTGGFGLDDKWLGHGRAPSEWRETNARFAGSTVVELQAEFVANWATARGEILADGALTRNGDASGTAAGPMQTRSSGSADLVLAALVRSPPLMGSTAAERLIALAIGFDNLTLAHNSEVALVALDAGIGRHMDALFVDDAQYTDEIVLADFERRVWTARVVERLASVGSRLL